MFSATPPSSFALSVSRTSSALDCSTLPAIDSAPPITSHCMPDGCLYNFNYAPYAAVPLSPYLHDARGFYPMTSSPAYMPHAIPPAMYTGRPTIGPPPHKWLRSERGNYPHRLNHNDDDAADHDLVHAHHHYSRKRHRPSSPLATLTPTSSSGGESGVPVYISRDEYRKMKNRQSAARSREKSLANVRVLEQRVAALEQENDYLLGLLASISVPSTTLRTTDPAEPTTDPLDISSHAHVDDGHPTNKTVVTNKFTDRVASHCVDDLPDGLEWCL